ncbi:hypothetical protein GCM10011506_45600 [Marivirga lumbricoides]|uniref:EF-hand domain-containing protein n=1 Tax=Marivirga lumbricoides TaxID=1046115 RepID=A0ABQ1N8W9_9BACT|nr:hypothetical protein GCM10011506_45600 [Marivirga lumbricoides]
MRKLIIIIAAITILSNCNNPNPKKINHEIKIDTVATEDDRMEDSTKVLVSELPIKFDSTNVLLHTIGLVELNKRGDYSKYSSASYSNSGIGNSYFNSDNFSGEFINIIFEDESGKRLLSKNKITIKKGIFLREIFEKTKSGYILYSVYDRDTNGDNKLDSDDIESLYISMLNGSDFTKITKELHELYDYRLIKGENKLYYRTLEDVDKDGKLTSNDQFHYYFLAFRKDGYSNNEYYPLEVFK